MCDNFSQSGVCYLHKKVALRFLYCYEVRSEKTNMLIIVKL